MCLDVAGIDFRDGVRLSTEHGKTADGDTLLDAVSNSLRESSSAALDPRTREASLELLDRLEKDDVILRTKAWSRVYRSWVERERNYDPNNAGLAGEIACLDQLDCFLKALDHNIAMHDADYMEGVRNERMPKESEGK